jgi:two-component system phosphate regulon sensor histidine kinase PhoR
MSLRTATAYAICAALLAAAALCVSRPLLAASIIASSLAGAAAALLLAGRGGRARDEADGRGEAVSGGEAGRESSPVVAEDARGALPAGELLESLMTSMREGLLVVDAAGHVAAMNPAAELIFGARTEGRAGRRLSDVTRNPEVLSAFAEALERGGRVEVKVGTHERGGRSFELRVSPLRGAGGARGAVGVLFDITRLERLERVRQEFLSNVSHELRTPLTAIRAFAETLERGAIDDPEHNRRFLSVIDRNAARMHTLIDDILELSAIEAGNFRLEPRVVSLRPLVEDVLTAVASRAGERGVALRNEVPEAPPSAQTRAGSNRC